MFQETQKHFTDNTNNNWLIGWWYRQNSLLLFHKQGPAKTLDVKSSLSFQVSRVVFVHENCKVFRRFNPSQEIPLLFRTLQIIERLIKEDGEKGLVQKSAFQDELNQLGIIGCFISSPLKLLPKIKSNS